MGANAAVSKRTRQNNQNDSLKRKSNKTRATPVNRGSQKVSYLTEDELARLFRCITTRRDRALFSLAYHRGLRASEVGILQFSDVRLSAGRLYVTRLKGSHSGEFRLCDGELALLRAWMRERGAAPGPLFPSRNHRPISRQRLDALMKLYGAAAGIPREKRHFHCLKHSCGTHLLTREGDITLVQDHLGHVNIQSTQVYAKVTNKRRDDLAERVRKDW